MYIENPNCEILEKAYFLLVKKYTALFSDRILKIISNYYNDKNFYAIRALKQPLEQMPIQYQGVDREPIEAGFDTVYLHNENKMAGHSLAEHKMHEKWQENPIDLRGLGYMDFQLTSLHDALDVLKVAEVESPNIYEIIWAKIAGFNATPPEGFILAGYEPSFFPEGYFSPLCDCMCVPRWHGSDEEGILFRDYFQQLNQYGLFNDAETALAFLKYYCSFDWTETGEYQIIEIWISR